MTNTDMLRFLKSGAGNRSTFNVAVKALMPSTHPYSELELLAFERLREFANLWTMFVAAEPEVATQFEERVAVAKVTKELRKK
jgi:hypothetical protein